MVKKIIYVKIEKTNIKGGTSLIGWQLHQMGSITALGSLLAYQRSNSPWCLTEQSKFVLEENKPKENLVIF